MPKIKQPCAICRRRVMTITSRCRCEQIICSDHTFSHNCSYDYRSEHQKKLVKTLPVICASKLPK